MYLCDSIIVQFRESKSAICDSEYDFSGQIYWSSVRDIGPGAKISALVCITPWD